jgi:beta-N-acetylglucosaminidase/uncharacterized protein YraI
MRLHIDKTRKRKKIAAVYLILAAIGVSEIYPPVPAYATETEEIEEPKEADTQTVEDITGDTEGTEDIDITEDTESLEIPSEENDTEMEALIEEEQEETDLLLASQSATGTVTANNVNVRSGPGTSYATIGVQVNKGQSLTIVDEKSTNGTPWYSVKFTLNGKSYSGWIISTYVSKSTDTASGTDTVDEKYVASLKKLGFPESYCTALAKLHAKYPDWQFVPVSTGLDWNTVVAQESKAGVNLVQSTVNDSRKSTESYAYDWSKNKWYGYDGADWVSASSDFIAYCMDPRNFLTEEYIFQFETLEYADYQNVDGIKSILSNTFMSGNYTDTDSKKRSYAKTFLTAGKNLKVSPYHLAARCKQEQGVQGTSQLISGTYKGYEGYYNYFNVGAYTTTAADKVVNGLAYAKKAGWNSIYKAILGGSETVAEKYIKVGQNTIYFEKFNVVNTSSLYSHQYMTNVMAAISEGSSSGKAYTDKNQAFVFRIPVYENMPKKAVTFKDSGNPNNWLSSLKVSGQSLTPSFNGSKTSYTIVVDAGVSSIKVSAEAVASTSTVSGTGKYALEYGDNTIMINCISQSGATRTYTIKVARKYPTAGIEISVGEGVIYSPAVSIETYVTGVAPGMKTSDVLSQLSASDGTIEILESDGTTNTNNVATGNKLAFYDENGDEVEEYEVVIYGDLNGDGKISNADLVTMQKHILGISTLEGVYLEAADAGRDGAVSNKDLVMLQKHILGIEDIEQ